MDQREGSMGVNPTEFENGLRKATLKHSANGHIFVTMLFDGEWIASKCCNSEAAAVAKAKDYVRTGVP